MTDRVVRLSGAIRTGTAAQISEEALWEAPLVADGQRAEHVVDTVVLAAGQNGPDELDRAWTDVLPASGVAGRLDTVVLITGQEPEPASERGDHSGLGLVPATDRELHRLFGLAIGETDMTKEVIIAGCPDSSVSADMQTRLEQRFTVRRVPEADSAACQPVRDEPEGDLEARTAAALADEAVRDAPATTALIATRRDFADALALAGVAADRDLPLLYVDRDRVPPATCQWLADHQADLEVLHIAGGVAAVAGELDKDLLDCGGGRVERHAGDTRFHTAVQIAESFFPDPGGFIVASGRNFPDALTGANLSRVERAPVLLTEGRDNPATAEVDGLERVVFDYINANEQAQNRAYVLGGLAAVHQRTENQMEDELFP